MTPHRLVRRMTAAITASVTCLALAACGDGGDPNAPLGVKDGRLTVWTLDSQPDRMGAQRKIMEAFTTKTGIQTELVGIDEAQFPQLIASAAQSGTLPDVVASLGLGSVRQIDQFGLVDRDATTKVVDRLGRDTFSPAMLDLETQDGKVLAVPSDSWSQILVYRKDLFKAKGLKPPTTYADLTAAAKALTAEGKKGITLATDPADPFTSQSFETLALGNSCQLVDDAGAVTLGDQRCQRTWDLYADLVRNYSPQTKQDVDTTRASYFAGESAMVLWSAYLLDEMAGLREDALPTCPECKDDPTFLARNSGVVTAVRGPDGTGKGSFGEVAGWALIRGSDVDQGGRLIEHVMTDGYQAWLGVAPEGKFPTRPGPTKGSTAYVDAWAKLPAGVDTKKPLAEVYPPDVLASIRSSASTIDRWGIAQGRGILLGAVTSELPIPKAVAGIASGSLDARQAAEQAATAVDDIRKDLN